MSIGREDRRAFVLCSEGSAGWAKAMMREIDEALRFIGIDSTLLQPIDWQVVQAAGPERCFLVDANHKAAAPVPLRKFSVMVDHPCTRLGDVQQGHPDTEILGWVDETHIPAAAMLGLPYRSIFLPHAGPDPVADPLPMAERDIDLFFSGMLAEPAERISWISGHPEIPEIVAHLIFDTIEAMERGGEPVMPVFLRVCAGHGIEVARTFSGEAFGTIVTKIHEIAEMNRRHRVLEALPDLRIGIVSDYLPQRLRDRANLVHFGPIDDFDEIRRLMGRARIVLNSSAKFPRGAHERIWFAMAEGAVVLTSRSAYLEADFADGRDILYLPDRPGPEDLASLQEFVAGNGPAEMAARTRALYWRKHTWKQRIWTIHDAMART